MIVLTGCATIATMVKLMSFLIIKETRNPDHDNRYKTNLAGTCPETMNELLLTNIISDYTTTKISNENLRAVKLEVLDDNFVGLFCQ